jgi:plastocyanin
VISVTTTGSFSLTNDINKGGNLSSQTISGTYTVDASGRAILTVPAQGVLAGIYLVSPNQGFVLTTSNSVESGFVEPQTGGPFTISSVTGTFFFGTTNQVDQNVSDNSGFATFDGAGNVTGTSDNASIGSTPTTPNLNPGQTFTNTDVVTNGTGTPGRGTVSMGGTLNLIFYIISPSKAVLLGAQTGNAYPAISVAESALAPVTVVMKNIAYNPKSITIPAGTTVTWDNQDFELGAPHSATANDGSFDTGVFIPGQEASIKFSKSGTIPYFCTVHGQSMSGTIIVQ